MVLWSRFDVTLRSLWNHFGAPWSYLGVTWGSLWGTLVSLWGHFGVTLGHFQCTWGHFNLARVTLYHFGTTLGQLLKYESPLSKNLNFSNGF